MQEDETTGDESPEVSSAEAANGKRVALKLKADPDLLSKRAEIRRCLDQFVEFQGLDEDTAEGYNIYKTCVSIELDKGITAMQARTALDRYIAKWSASPPGKITISFKEGAQTDD